MLYLYDLNKNPLPFTKLHQHTLREVIIDDDHPATVLHDFNCIIALCRESKQPLTPGHQPTLEFINALNPRLKHPFQTAVKRATHKNYPNIQGLFLLARAVGLTYVDTSGRIPLLAVEETAYARWETLNSTERYGNLLEAWLMRGNDDVLGERPRGFFAFQNKLGDLFRFAQFFRGQAEIQVAGNRDLEGYFGYTPSWHNLALLETFGLIEVESNPPLTKKRWHIDRITLTPYGSALFGLLYNQLVTGPQMGLIEDIETKYPHLIQKILKPYFRRWKNTFDPPKPSFQEGTHIFKVSLGSVWRKLLLMATRP